MNLNALYNVKLIFGKYFYFDLNCVATSLQLQLYLDINHVPVCERVNCIPFFLCAFSFLLIVVEVLNYLFSFTPAPCPFTISFSILFFFPSILASVILIIT